MDTNTSTQIQQMCLLIRGQVYNARAFVDALLDLAFEVKEISCKPLGNERLLFTVQGSLNVEVALEGAVGRLRSILPGLSSWCSKVSGQECHGYGGHYIFEYRNEEDGRFDIDAEFCNTPAAQWFAMKITEKVYVIP
ncbi:MAG: hypothetical protein ACYDCO_19050 [Armatimonadota bacterium]